jgi:hypothetical protein
VEHFVITTPFFQLLFNFVSIHLLMGESSSDFKAIAATYNYLYTLETGGIEPSFARFIHAAVCSNSG